ncbi:hypothetical protein RvY_14850 [Ramazzottius varieornatus]|uniref:HTH psq-type domain-containing protein n=1 Tax=Ramazzottius varieornatus TaxID=947166 RepID=A0A1D1VUH2_RAMVA|nr:hypothetical protein RvY_14850 [Ramazzottius varieornatus]
MAAEKYHIPYRTLANRVNRKHGRTVGRSNTFTLEEESEISEILNVKIVGKRLEAFIDEEGRTAQLLDEWRQPLEAMLIRQQFGRRRSGLSARYSP